MLKRFAFLPILLLALASLPAAATSVVVGTDEDLFDQAPVVLEGTILSSAPAPGLPATQYRVRVERTLKAPGGKALTGNFGEIVVRVLGGDDVNGNHLTIWGAPSLQTGERALLFLVRHADGTYGPLHLALGAFHEVTDLSDIGRKLAVRDLAEMQDVGGGEAVPAEDTARDAGRFASWLADRAAGLLRPADYFVKGGAELRHIQEKFNYLGGIKQRWNVFDSGGSVSWRYQASGQPGLDDGGVSEIKAAMGAWNGDPATNINYHLDGTTSATNGFKRSDGVNAIIFEDPNGEVDGTFTCSSPGRGSGVLAIGGTWTNGSTGGVARVVEGDVITNDGVGCWFNTPKRAEQIFGHELGHSLGLGHSCGDDRTGPCTDPLEAQAIMRATAFNDERGARLNEDDLAAILTLYPGSSNPPPPPPDAPAAPTNLVATVASASSIQLTWTDNATDETEYRVEMKRGSGAFQEIRVMAANSTSVTITGLQPQTLYTFRVRDRKGSVSSAYSNLASVTTPSSSLPAAPSSLTATPVSAMAIRLDWKDNASNEIAFDLEVASPNGTAVTPNAIAANAHSFTVGGLTPDTPYTFRVRAVNGDGLSAFSNPASATTQGGTTGPCVGSAGNLCLLGGRFRVAVRFRAQGVPGTGQAVPRSDQTGLFWFFDAANIELIVKMIDGQGVNGFFWTYYGGLSDVEYWITVTDTQKGDTKTYHNPPGSLCGLGDVNAFAHPAADTAGELAAPAIASKAGCAPGTLCLQGGRFQVSVSWKTGSATGTGTPVPLTDQSGMFWFFDPSNIELVIKVLDARSLNGKFWVYYGALSDVEYDLTVTDTTTGFSHTYHNTQGNLCGKGDTTTFPG